MEESSLPSTVRNAGSLKSSSVCYPNICSNECSSSTLQCNFSPTPPSPSTATATTAITVKVSTATTSSMAKKKKKNAVPDTIILDDKLNKAISMLPSNYNFEIHKTIWRIQQEKISLVALQFPEGLLMYSCIISDILSLFTSAEVLILADVTYGACCVDDYTAVNLGAELLIHYGHSCLVPISVTKIKVMYIFVEIYLDHTHLVAAIKANFKRDARLIVMGTIQFNTFINQVQCDLKDEYSYLVIPQSKPLSAGETLGCTSPVLPADCTVLIFVADGRFHLEAAMIRNPDVPAYRYDPYSKVLSIEKYDVEKMKEVRYSVINKAKSGMVFGLILGTLGRQGNTSIFNRLKKIIESKNKIVIPFLMAEIIPTKISRISEIDVWVQVACPRLSIDWGLGFEKPLLNPYELEVALGGTEWKSVYPMDYYSSDGGTWTNYSKDH